jgi:N-acetylmuramoyl-L-alanine amidase
MEDLGVRDPPLSCSSRARRASRVLALAAFVSLGLLAGHLSGQSPATPLTLLARDGRRPLPLALVGDQEYVALDDLAAAFQLIVREESGALTVSYKGRTIVLTPDQALVSVAGRLVSLPAPPARSGRRWLVPIDFISRALAPIYDARLDLRKPSHLVVVGDVRVPHLTIRFEPLGAAVRLTIDATPRANAAVTQDADKLLVRYDADALDVAVPPIPTQGLVQLIRVADATSLAVDLGPRFASYRATTQPTDTSTRLIIDLVAAQTETAPSASPSPTPAPPPDLTTLTQPTSSIRTIAIDPGHGGDDAGASGAGGTKEKDLTLAVARRLKAAIEGRLGVRVLLTRDDDRNVAVDDRTAVANNNKADVFISLHASASMRPTMKGATIFVAAFDRDAETAAGASPGAERVTTFSGVQRDIELVPWDLAQLRHVERSAAFARIVEQQLHDRIPLSPHAIDRGPLRLLEAANMPAVVVEMGYLTSAEQEKQLAGGEFQSSIVQALVESVVKFRDVLDAERRPPTLPGGAP